MINAGKLRHRITIQKFNGELDSFGDPLQTEEDNWVDVATTWAAIDPVSGREFYAASQSQSEVTHKIRCRYRSGLTPSMRILFGTREFRIISVINWEERRESLLLMCRELIR